ncbi:MAG: Glyoxylate/hydroxypyruvate reductase B [Steroidobacteraceae bacterium]|nr:Glyoxylate/hydroxypyruvate reductase B [Steroidobacteraceae bacterium]
MKSRIALLAVAAMLAATTRTVAATEAPADVAQVIATLGLRADTRPARAYPHWRPLRRIVVRGNFGPDAREFLAPAAAGAGIIVASTLAEALAAAPGTDAFLGFCDAALLAAAKEARWIQAFSVGVENCVDIPVLRARPIMLTNMQRVLGPPMAEHAMALLLALARRLDAWIAHAATGRWDDSTGDGVPVRTLAGKTLLVVGLGGIGTEVATRAHALGMKVIATRASGRGGPPFVEYVGKPGELLALAAHADAVIAALPLTDATRGLFDARFFAAMKRGAYFINLGRGASVVTADLVGALRSGQVGGAGLDVTDPEPLPPDHPLWHAPRTIITPHMSATDNAGHEYRRLITRENLRRYQAGEPLLSVVDVARGY